MEQPSLAQTTFQSPQSSSPHINNHSGNMRLMFVFVLIVLALSLCLNIWFYYSFINGGEQNVKDKPQQSISLVTSPIPELTSVVSTISQVITPSIVTSATESANLTWHMQLPKLSFSIDELGNDETQPFIEKLYGVDATLFTPLLQKEPICKSSSYLEKSSNEGWVRLCDKIAEQNSDLNESLSCEAYDVINGVPIYAHLTNSLNCNLRGQPIEEGVYRIKTKAYAQCKSNIKDGKEYWGDVYPANCLEVQEVVSPEITISN